MSSSSTSATTPAVDLSKHPHPLPSNLNHRAKYPVMTRYNLFFDPAYGPSPYDTRRLLEELIAYQRTITHRENIVRRTFHYLCTVSEGHL